MNYKHGLRFTKRYSVWHGMMQRCYNPNSTPYKYYGAKGITVDKRWHDVENFCADMEEPAEDLQLDRIDNNKGYSKENCRWASRGVNQRNKRWTGNLSGVKGLVYQASRNRYFAYTEKVDLKKKQLYQGKDFFEACCARKSWETVQH